MSKTAWDFLDSIKKDIDKILKLRILSIPIESKLYFPELLRRKKVFYNLVLSDRFFILSFTPKLQKDISDFPGLITFDPTQPSAFAFEGKSKNNYLDKCKVENLYSLKLGIDCTVILSNHKQIINTKDQKINYIIDFAYILTFGEEIKADNIIEYTDDLIIYSTSLWSKPDGL